MPSKKRKASGRTGTSWPDLMKRQKAATVAAENRASAAKASLLQLQQQQQAPSTPETRAAAAEQRASAAEASLLQLQHQQKRCQCSRSLASVLDALEDISPAEANVVISRLRRTHHLPNEDP